MATSPTPTRRTDPVTSRSRGPVSMPDQTTMIFKEWIKPDNDGVNIIWPTDDSLQVVASKILHKQVNRNDWAATRHGWEKRGLIQRRTTEDGTLLTQLNKKNRRVMTYVLTEHGAAFLRRV